MSKNKIPTCKELQDQVNQLKEGLIVALKSTHDNSQKITEIIDFLTPPEVNLATADVAYILQRLMNTTGLTTYQGVKQFLSMVEKVNKGAAYSMLLRLIAVILDESYEGNIKDSPEIYVYSTLDGKIYKQDKSRIKNYQNFAAFRTINDARAAINLVGKIRKFLKNVED